MIDTLVSFRNKIRNQALHQKKGLKSWKKAHSSPPSSTPNIEEYRSIVESQEAHVNEMMTSCDELRSELLQHYGIELHDVKGQKTIWKYGMEREKTSSKE